MLAALFSPPLGAAEAPPAWQASLQQAVNHHQGGDFGAAATHYKQAMELHAPLQQHWPLLNNYGLVLQQDAPKEAASAFRKVIELNPSGADGYFNLGNALSDAEEHEGAAKAFDECVSLSPDDAEAHYNLGAAQLRCGGSDNAHAAVAALRRSLELQPAEPKSFLLMGDALAATRSWDEAVGAYRRGNELRPTHAAGWASLGNALEEGGRLAEAEKSWRSALALAPDESGTLQNLGAMLRRSDRMPESRSMYEAAVRASPTSAEAYMGLGKCHQAPSRASGSGSGSGRGGPDEYLGFLARTYGVALKLQPTNGGTYNQIGEAMTMYGLLGGCDEFDGSGAAEMYAHAHALAPANTCAATHVAFRDRRVAAAAEAAKRGGGGGGGPGEAAAGAAEASASSGESLDGDEARSLADLSVSAAELKRGGAEAAHRAAAIWRRHGVVIFPGLLSGKPLAALRERVAAAAKGNATGDYTTVTRDSRHRVHKSLPVDEARDALDAISVQIGPFLREALGASAGEGGGEGGGGGLPLLESGFMVTSPGADAQQFHRDVAPAVVSRSSLAVSCQVSIEDTAPTQGALEVVPGTNHYDARVTDRERLSDPRYAQLPVAVPAGTVTVYMLHTMHRGGANTHTKERPFYFFTLMGDGIAPPGLAYTMELDDIGRWQLDGDKLARRSL